jgi:ParB family chromosome partitioning protein
VAAPKKGLGRGLDAMIPSKKSQTGETSKTASKEEKINSTGETILKINEVEPNKNQPRKNFNEDSLLELSESIKLHGIVQPLVVAKQEGYYEIIAGERRWRAAKMAGLKEVPVVIKDYSPQEIMEVALIENIQREDLNPVEEARAYQRLIKEYNLKQDEVAEKVSKSRTAVTNSLRLLKLDDRVLDMLVDENISSGHARALLALTDKEQQYKIATEIFDSKLSVRETEKLVKNINNPPKKTEKKELKNDFVYRDIEEKLKQKIGTKVRINRKTEQKGKIEIEYYSPEELEKILAYFK